jgi:aldehyde:ferredoxin oxidoreductase
MYGYNNKLLRVDLTLRKTEIQTLDELMIEKYVGGAGIGTKILYDETSVGTDPFGPDNVLVAFTGPYTGTSVPASPRHHIMARSPLTGILGESNVGGSWAVNLKRAGFDGLVVKGASETPVYLWIHDDGVEIREAKHIWGKDTYASAATIKAETSKKATVSVIGQAGEKLSRISAIPHFGHLVRVAGRTGLGAVMGSKKLKGIAVFGRGKVPLADEVGLNKDVKSRLPHIIEATEMFRKYGTAVGIENYEKIGNFPIKNWRGSHWEGAKKISGPTMHDTVLSGRRACLKCPISCARHIKLTEGRYAPLDCEGPEYETLALIGGLCMVDDLPAICKANELCNRYGLDTMSTGSIIAFTMEAFEKGILTTKETDGIEVSWGNADAMVALVEKIGQREGIGKLMGEGSARMAQELGSNSEEFALHVKGLEIPGHDPRRFFGQALNYATSGRGSCHNASYAHFYEMAGTMPEIGVEEVQDPYGVEGKAEFVATMQNFMCVMDCLIICRFSQVGKAVTATNQLDWLKLITGCEMDMSDFIKTGERVFNLKRLYNTRLGISRMDDFLPARFLTSNREGEDITNQLPPIGRLLSDYYSCRGWSESGIPTKAKLDELDIK